MRDALLQIVMLNLLIAIMTDSYDNVRENSMRESAYEKFVWRAPSRVRALTHRCHKDLRLRLHPAWDPAELRDEHAFAVTVASACATG
eukprot:1012177-Pleurochrysis_carterae.AAC.4